MSPHCSLVLLLSVAGLAAATRSYGSGGHTCSTCSGGSVPVHSSDSVVPASVPSSVSVAPGVSTVPISKTSCTGDDGTTYENGQIVHGPNCQKFECNNGFLTTHFCKEVPSGCSALTRDLSLPFPGCCPRSQCFLTGTPVSHGPTIVKPVTSYCSKNGKRIENGQTIEGPNCQRFECRNGVLTTHFCREPSSSCSDVSRDLSLPFPHCCPRSSCFLPSGHRPGKGSIGVSYGSSDGINAVFAVPVGGVGPIVGCSTCGSGSTSHVPSAGSQGSSSHRPGSSHSGTKSYGK